MANHSRALDFIGLTIGIGDDPVAGQELRCFLASIDDGDMIAKEPGIVFWLRLVCQIVRGNTYLNASRIARIVIFH